MEATLDLDLILATILELIDRPDSMILLFQADDANTLRVAAVRGRPPLPLNTTFSAANEVADTTALRAGDQLIGYLSPPVDETFASIAAAAIFGATRTTELQRAQARLLEAKKMGALVHLVAGITHEMNSPVGALVSATNTLERAVSKIFGDASSATPSAAVLDALASSSRAAGEAAKRIDAIVRRLKSYVRLDEAKQQQVSVETCIDDALAMLRHRLEKISVVRDYGGTPAMLCYPARLNDVFSTILNNACDALEDNLGAKIVVRTRAYKKGLAVEIDDNGVGMSKEALQRIFEPGFTTRGTRVRMGMGLAIAYQIVHDHGGEISFESEIGYGTKVSIDFPARANPGAQGT